MRTLKPFEYFEPSSIQEAIRTLSQLGPEAAVLAGGTDLLISMKKRQLSPKYIISINNIPDMDHILYSQEGGLKIGSLATHYSVANSVVVKDKFNLLSTACNKVGNPHIRYMGTLGGNICKAGPSQDTIPPLLVLDAKLKLIGLKGERSVPVDEFFIGPFQTVLQTAELLTEIHVPTPPAGSAGCYKWLTKVTTVNETLVGVAVLMVVDSTNALCKDIKIGLCSVGPTPFRAKRAEEALRGKALEIKVVERVAQAALEDTKARSRTDYRARMTGFLVKQAIDDIWHKLTD